MEDVDAVADARLDRGLQPVHLSDAVAERHGGAADGWVTHGVRPRPLGAVMVVLDDVLVA
ncbi:hypothetical protein ABZT43_23665 [Streptomyces sp. NPDC005349]|uniref:hypothetical protein n=1 Tax=Streptomyces sp. NPDC005349 TaxID=3157037 RepID=UPI00339DD49D